MEQITIKFKEQVKGDWNKVQCHPNINGWELKQLLSQTRVGFSSSSMKLLYKGKFINDEQSLKEQNIVHNGAILIQNSQPGSLQSSRGNTLNLSQNPQQELETPQSVTAQKEIPKDQQYEYLPPHPVTSQDVKEKPMNEYETEPSHSITSQKIKVEKPIDQKKQCSFASSLKNEFYNSLVGVPKLPTGKLTIGKYIGSGHYGEVYEGDWEGRKVILKKIHIDKDPESLRWDVTQLSTLDHPNIVSFYGIYKQQEEDFAFMLMEY